MSADLVLAAMLALAPHQDSVLLQPIAEAVERATTGPTEPAILLAIWIDRGAPLTNPFGLARADLNLVRLAREASRSTEPLVLMQADHATRLFRGSFRFCGARTPLAVSIGYMRGAHNCAATVRDRIVAGRVVAILPLLRQRTP